MSALCPRCGIDQDGNRPPFCTDADHTHADTCATYTWADELCADCAEPQPAADDQTEAECQPNREASR